MDLRQIINRRWFRKEAIINHVPCARWPLPFSAAKLDIETKDRFGRNVKAHEWFLVPIFIIDEMVEKIRDGTISHYYYEPTSVELKKYLS